ncbi:MAG: hypothetical protein PVG86_02220 [Desulfobacterales bacterium]|jgi:hypothetical protein
MMDKTQKITPATIPSRFRMMAAGAIPQEDLKNINTHELKIFLTESDPNKWPPEIDHLKKYVREKQDA